MVNEQIISMRGPKPIRFSNENPSYYIDLYNWIFSLKQPIPFILTNMNSSIATLKFYDFFYFILRICQLSKYQKGFYILCTDIRLISRLTNKIAEHHNFDIKRLYFSTNKDEEFLINSTKYFQIFTVLFAFKNDIIVGENYNEYWIKNFPDTAVNIFRDNRIIIIKIEDL